MSKRNKVLASALVVGVLGSLTTLGVFGLFSATTQNAGNEITTGTVALTDNDAGQAMFNINNAEPGDSWTRCIQVSYNGSLPAETHIYLQRTPGPLEDHINMTLHQGTQANPVFPDCAAFAPNPATPIFDAAMTEADGDYETGLPVAPAGQTLWNPGDSLVFQVELTLDPATPDTLQNATTGTVTAVWEARNDS